MNRHSTTNNRKRERHMRCLRSLAAYTDSDEAVNLVDFLADAMHWCRAEGHDFAALLDTAEDHFKMEVLEEEGDLP